ncbi:MAG: hypothetical protein ACFFFB_24450 [Candidatus Heimdallarchaeota archaeon]
MSKIQGFLDKYFHQIFNNSHFLYTIVFLLSSLLIALLSFIPGTEVGNFILFLATTLSLSFIFLMFEGLIPQLEKYLFSQEKKFDRGKIACLVINFIIALIIILPYFLTGSTNQLTIQFLGWDIILPTLFIIIYFGWNVVQIFYLRIGFEEVSIKVDNKVNDKYGSSKKKDFVNTIILILAIIISFLLILGTFLGFLPEFISLTDPLVWYIGSNIIILIIMVITGWRLITLFYKSKKIGASNSYSSIFYIFVWLIIWFRAFGFLNALRGVVQSTTELEALTRLIDILLMLITAFLVLRGLGDKVYDSVFFNKNNMPFFLFSFTLLYIEGQIIMVTGAGSLSGVFADRNQINLINNFLIILVTISFYWWYSKHSLERKGFIIKKRFYPEEVAFVVYDFKDYLEARDLIGSNEIDEKEVKSFLDSKNIEIPSKEPPEEIRAIIEEDTSPPDTPP